MIFFEKQWFWIHYIKCIDYFQVLGLVSGYNLYLGTNTVSFPIYQSNFIGELIEINSQNIITHWYVYIEAQFKVCFFFHWQMFRIWSYRKPKLFNISLLTFWFEGYNFDITRIAEHAYIMVWQLYIF